MPVIRIHDNNEDKSYIATVGDRLVLKILKFIDGSSGLADFDVFIDDKWRGAFDEDEFADFKTTFSLHYKIEDDSTSSYYDAW